MVSELKDLLTKEEALSIRTCPWRSKTFSLLNPGSSQAVCKKTDSTIVFSYCLKCDAFKGKDSLDKSWNVDSKPRFDMWDSIKPWINCKHKEMVDTDMPGKKTLKCCASVDQKQGRSECKKCGLNTERIYKMVDLKIKEEYVHRLFNENKDSVPNDQTAKADAGKAQLSLVPQKIIYAIARIREYGNNKYPEGGKDNWKSVEKQRYVDAMLRHISAYVTDPEGVDEESGLPHLWHAACDMAFILEKEDE